jgi:hypothetical protein
MLWKKFLKLEHRQGNGGLCMEENLPSSRQTELSEAFPIHVVAEWLGNSPKTALAHYTQVTRRAKSGAAPAMARTRPQEEDTQTSYDEDLRDLAACCNSLQDEMMTPTGFEPSDASRDATGYYGDFQAEALQNAVQFLADRSGLREVLAAWPTLSEADRAAVLGIVRRAASADT